MFRISYSENYNRNIEDWKYTEGTLNKTESVQDEKTIFFPLDSNNDVRYWEISYKVIFKTFKITNIPIRYVAIVVKSYYDNRGGIHYFSENLSSQSGATYQGFYKKKQSEESKFK